MLGAHCLSGVGSVGTALRTPRLSHLLDTAILS
jgi:hypothetical protein